MEKILERLREQPSPTLVSRYKALIAELPDDDEKKMHALALAEVLVPSDPDQALTLAHAVYQSDPRSVRALDVLIAVMNAKGRYGKVEVLRAERLKLEKKNAPTVNLANMPLIASPSGFVLGGMHAGPLPSPAPPSLAPDRGLAATPEHRTLRLDDVPVKNGPDRDIDLPPAASVDASEISLLFPVEAARGQAPLAAHGAPEAETRLLAASNEQAPFDYGAAPPSQTHFGFSPFVPPDLSTQHDASAQAAAQVAAAHAANPHMIVAQSIAAQSLAAQAMAAQAFAAQAFAAHAAAAQVAAAHVASGTPSDLGGAVEDAQAATHEAPGIPDKQRPSLSPGDGPCTAERAEQLFHAALTAHGGADPTTRKALLWELAQSFWGSAPDAECARFLEAQSGTALDPAFFGLYLDALLAAGAPRRVLAVIRTQLHAHPQLSWARSAFHRIPAAYAGLGSRAFLWSEDDGVDALRKKLEARPEPSLAKIVAVSA